MTARPARSEAAEDYFTYINQVGEGDIRAILERQGPEILALLCGIDDDWSRYRYAPDEWTIRQVVSHVSETIGNIRAVLWLASRPFSVPAQPFPVRQPTEDKCHGV